MSIEIGTVIGQSDGAVRVQLVRKDACTGCKACLLNNDGFMIATAKNSKGADIGDKVRLEFTTPGQARSGFILYILPLLLFIPGYFLGARLGMTDSQSTSDAQGFVGGILAIALTYFAIYRLQSVKEKKDPRFKVIEVLS